MKGKEIKIHQQIENNSLLQGKFILHNTHTHPNLNLKKMVKSEPVLCIQPAEEPGSKNAKRSDNMNIEIMNQTETTHQYCFVYFMK